jgi:hypothetical protein
MIVIEAVDAAEEYFSLVAPSADKSTYQGPNYSSYHEGSKAFMNIEQGNQSSFTF